jgi:membrane associated rhomboid family serine protease
MFLAIPLGTDAPIYYWPKATVAAILINIAVFVALPGPPDREPDDPPSTFERYALTLGDGLHPVQWVTHNFLHFDPFHLIGNIIFLWAFGIVVEGKLGALKFVPAYLAIGTAHGASVQTLMLGFPHVVPAAGASAVIFGLMAMCMIWAPRNELNCWAIFIVVFRVFVFNWDLRYTTVALFYIGLQVLGLVLAGMLGAPAISEMGHMSGAFWGFVMAIALVRLRWVDCEGWDLFSLLAKRRQLARDWKRRGEQLDRQQEIARQVARPRRDDAADEPSPEQRAGAAARRVGKFMEAGDFDNALIAYDKASRSLPGWPPEPELLAWIKALHAKQERVASLPLMRDYCRLYPRNADRVRLLLAQVLIRDQQRPGQALRVLSQLPERPLPGPLEQIRGQLTRQARQMQEEGVLEVEGDEF